MKPFDPLKNISKSPSPDSIARQATGQTGGVPAATEVCAVNIEP